MNISDEAVEAAFETLRAVTVTGPVRVDRREIRQALEAAAPYLVAQVWESGYLMSHYLDRGYDEAKAATYPAPAHLQDQLNKWNPYRSQA